LQNAGSVANAVALAITELSISMDDEKQGPKPEDVRAALKGWAFFGVGVLAVFGAAYVWVEML
jgi:hypothetical protein